jgi:NAD(P)-dependent dehydrogenase (short-subunit alcohol dehydrogenase family)
MARTVVITGATAGVGRATARRFAAEGARIGLLARGREGLEATRIEIEDLGGRAHAISADVADPDAVEAAAQAFEDALGEIDVWVNNAMATVLAPVRMLTPDEIRRVTEVTYLGQVHGTMAALRRMRPRDRGVIVQVGSALAYRAIPLQSAYCAAKHAVKGFTESLRCELLHDRSGVGIVMVQLPALNTPQFRWALNKLPLESQPVPPIYQPEVAAEAVVYAADHPRQRELWVTGSTWRAIVGTRIAPGVADRVLARIGYSGQQIEGQPVPPGRPHNLWAPVEGDFGAHGAFDARARRFSPVQWVSTRRRSIAAAAGVAAVGLGLGAWLARG